MYNLRLSFIARCHCHCHCRCNVFIHLAVHPLHRTTYHSQENTCMNINRIVIRTINAGLDNLIYVPLTLNQSGEREQWIVPRYSLSEPSPVVTSAMRNENKRDQFNCFGTSQFHVCIVPRSVKTKGTSDMNKHIAGL